MATMKFNDIDLSDMLTIMSINRDIGNQRSVSTNTSPLIGVFINQVKVDAKTISVDFYLKDRSSDYSLNILKHDLAGIFNVDEPVKIEFSDEPDKYYLGLPVSKISASDPIAWLSLVTIEFLIPDGVAHSKTKKKVTKYTIQDGKLVFDLLNKGTLPALPIITAKMNSENGYFGLVNESGVMEIGDRELIDSETLAYSERPFDYSDTGTKIADGFAKGAKNVAILNDSLQTLDKNLGIVADWNRNHLALTGAIAPSGNHAGSLTFDLPIEGSLYDHVWWRQIFWAWNINQYGFIKISVSDTDGKFLFGVETIKRKSGVETEYNVQVTDGNGGWKFTDFRKKFNCTHKNENPFNQGRGWTEIKRIDDKLIIHWNGSQFERIIPELKGKKSAKLHVAIGSMQGKPLVRKMYVDGIKYRKDNVADGYNIPNPYGVGSEVVINGENKTLLVDNIPKLNHIVDYSKWLTIPPGKSTIELNISSWSESNPDVTVEYEERWL
ncbi:phage tail protein [Streptococcus bovimastitidis]|uniref:Phage tail protein n=1 Tax=Streptococcus bovimastitidis TaxID=1856638 RepID=A0A1L8MKH0_9STRE|nr:distal tail protein Dit [Streptococcus bovimastitidis]OJF71254.1 phage tail protein [Streptococcus bovimastitidis]